MIEDVIRKLKFCYEQAKCTLEHRVEWKSKGN